MPKQYNIYYEPFLGGGALYFHFKPRKTVIGDNNVELIKAYEGVRNNPMKVIKLLKILKAKHSKELFYRIRIIDRELDIFKELLNEEIAARLIYLNQTCFNGIYRVNKKGQFNVPIGSSLNRLICDEKTILLASNILKNAKIYVSDFEELTRGAKNDDFVYFDPPYYPIAKYSDFTRYTKEKFYKEDQIRLSKVVEKLSLRGVKVMISNSDSDYIKDLYSKYEIGIVNSSRSLNVKKDKRGKINEILITNY